MAVGDIYIASIYSHAADRTFMNVVAYRETVEDIGSDVCQALSKAIANSEWLNLQNLCGDNWIHGAVNVAKIQGSKEPSGITYYVDKEGQLVGEAVPGNIGIRINQNGQHQGRSSRGAIILGGLPETYLNDGEWGTVAKAAVQTFANNLNNNDVDTEAPNTGTFTMGFMSRAPVVAGEPLIAWPGTFVKPDNMSVAGFPVTIRSRQTHHRALRTS